MVSSIQLKGVDNLATNKNITMKQFNGTDYDTLYPKTIASQIPDVYSKTNTITAETLSQLGLSADKLPNDAFQQIKTLIDNVQSSTDSKARIQAGSYVGTGTYGKNNPCSLTFDFEPKFIFCSRAQYPTNEPLYASTDRYRQYCFTAGWTTTPQENYGFGIRGTYSGSTYKELYGYTSTDRKTYYWYTQGNAEGQANDSGSVYYWLGIG